MSICFKKSQNLLLFSLSSFFIFSSDVVQLSTNVLIVGLSNITETNLSIGSCAIISGLLLFAFSKKSWFSPEIIESISYNCSSVKSKFFNVFYKFLLIHIAVFLLCVCLACVRYTRSASFNKLEKYKFF